MFMSHADAVAVFPGGFGTQDEMFEALTLVQTGKSNPVPIVLLEGTDGRYWDFWDNYVQKNLLAGGMISPEDLGLYFIAKTVDEAVQHVLRFYRVYHSSRYVGDELVLRLTRSLTDEQVDILNQEFGDLVKDGTIHACRAFADETEHLDLPRLTFKHTRRQQGRVRALIDRINGFAPADGPDVTSTGRCIDGAEVA